MMMGEVLRTMPKDYDAVSGYDKEREEEEEKRIELDKDARERLEGMEVWDLLSALGMDDFECAEFLGLHGTELLHKHWRDVTSYEKRRSYSDAVIGKMDGYKILSCLGISSLEARWLLIDFGSELLLEECGEQLLEKVRG